LKRYLPTGWKNSTAAAYHYAKAERWEKAHEYLMKAADQAGQMAADAEALNHYRQAMTAYSRAFGDQWEPLQRARLERKMGEALYRRGEHAQALAYLERGMALLGHQLPVRGVMCGWDHARSGADRPGTVCCPACFCGRSTSLLRLWRKCFALECR